MHPRSSMFHCVKYHTRPPLISALLYHACFIKYVITKLFPTKPWFTKNDEINLAQDYFAPIIFFSVFLDTWF